MSNQQKPITENVDTFFDIPIDQVIGRLGFNAMYLIKMKELKSPQSIIDHCCRNCNKWSSIINIRQKEYIDEIRPTLPNQTNSYYLENAFGLSIIYYKIKRDEN